MSRSGQADAVYLVPTGRTRPESGFPHPARYPSLLPAEAGHRSRTTHLQLQQRSLPRQKRAHLRHLCSLLPFTSGLGWKLPLQGLLPATRSALPRRTFSLQAQGLQRFGRPEPRRSVALIRCSWEEALTSA